ncbi:MAG TPA: hypothetical protein VEW69_09725, partial [Alphaproteobacteria bacterium]|nr:hypothetical protein [Alphaproteobacteria bacterium]
MRRLTKTLQSVFWHSLALTLTMPVVFGQVSLQLVSARDHIAGCFTTSQSVYADKNYIYLASWEGQLFVLARNRASNFPLVDTIQVSASPLLAVRGDSNYIYMVSGDGDLHVYQNKAPFLHVNSVPLSSAGLGALALASTKSGESIYVSTGQAQLAAYGSGVYLSP